MRARHAKLITVLIFAAMLLILGLLVASVTGCAPAPASSVHIQVVPMPTAIEDGTMYHPYSVDPVPYASVETWSVLTVKGPETWALVAYEDHSQFDPKAGDYILYNGVEYQISSIDHHALMMGVVPLGN